MVHQSCGLGGLGIHWGGREVEGQRSVVGLYAHIVDVIPGPTGGDGEGVGSLLHEEEAYLHLVVLVEPERGAGFVHLAVHHLLASYTVASHIYGVFPSLIQIDGEVVFLNSLRTSVKNLAQQLIAGLDRDENSLGGSLNYLAIL